MKIFRIWFWMEPIDLGPEGCWMVMFRYPRNDGAFAYKVYRLTETNILHQTAV